MPELLRFFTGFINLFRDFETNLINSDNHFVVATNFNLDGVG
jgi:hypothetical protein